MNKEYWKVTLGEKEFVGLPAATIIWLIIATIFFAGFTLGRFI